MNNIINFPDKTTAELVKNLPAISGQKAWDERLWREWIEYHWNKLESED